MHCWDGGHEIWVVNEPHERKTSCEWKVKRFFQNEIFTSTWYHYKKVIAGIPNFQVHLFPGNITLLKVLEKDVIDSFYVNDGKRSDVAPLKNVCEQFHCLQCSLRVFFWNCDVCAVLSLPLMLANARNNHIKTQ